MEAIQADEYELEDDWSSFDEADYSTCDEGIRGFESDNLTSSTTFVDELFLCETCGKTFSRQNSLITHNRMHQPRSAKPKDK